MCTALCGSTYVHAQGDIRGVTAVAINKRWRSLNLSGNSRQPTGGDNLKRAQLESISGDSHKAALVGFKQFIDVLAAKSQNRQGGSPSPVATFNSEEVLEPLIIPPIVSGESFFSKDENRPLEFLQPSMVYRDGAVMPSVTGKAKLGA